MAGSYVAQLIVNDGETDSAADTVTITVDNVAPTADAGPDQTVDQGDTVTLDGSGSSDPGGDALTYSWTLTTVPAGSAAALSSSTAQSPTFVADVAGSYVAQLIVNDGETDSAADTVTITVSNVAPTAIAQSVETNEDTAISIMLTGSDPGGDALTFAIIVSPVNGTLSGTAPDLVYSPSPDFNGTDSFTFTVNDGEIASAEATIDITIDPINDAPFLDTPIDEQFAIEGSEFSLDISGNFVDTDGDPITFEAVNLPASGNIVFDQATGVFSGTPLMVDARDNDPYIVTVTATDGDVDTLPAETQFNLNISALDRANVSLEISVAPDPAMVQDELQWTMTASNAIGPQAATNVRVTGSIVGTDLTVSSANTCTIEAPVGLVTDFQCSLGNLPVGGSANVVLTTTTSSTGDVVAFGTAASADPLPLDPFEADNSSQLAAGIAESFSNGAVQELGNVEVRAVAAGDVNGDGATDLVIGTAAGQPIQVYLSSGFRDFDIAAIVLPDSAANEGIALADFDGNGTLDLVSANGGGNPDFVYSNEGSGVFVEMQELGQTFAQDVAVGDFNGDSVPDIVVATIQGGEVYLGDGVGGFSLDVTLGTANSRGVAVGRIDGDALDDIVFANTGSDSQVWVQNAAGGFSEGARLPIGNAVSVVVSDLDGDTRFDDLAFARIPAAPGDVSANPVLINDGSGVFGEPVALLGVAPTNDIHAGDVNRDAIIDLVFINSIGLHQIWTGLGGAAFELYGEQIVDGDSDVGVLAELGMADIDEPGGVDLAMGGGMAAGLGVFLNDGFGNLGMGDAVPPVLTLNGESSVTIPSGSNYVDAGASADDNIDGDISSSVRVSNPVNTSLVGEYTVTYDVVDSAGNSATPITRTVLVSPAAGTGGGGGGVTGLPLLILLMLASCLVACSPKRAIIPVHNRK